MQITLKCLVAVAALIVAWQVGQATYVAERTAAEKRSEPPPARPVPVGGQFRGMAIQLHGGPDVYERYHKLIPEIAGLGADTVQFVVHGWQTHGGTLDLHIDPLKTASAEDIGRLCDLAKVHGLRTILMPIVLLMHPRNNEWRGKIIPNERDWDTWFRRYRRFIVHFARIAERHQVEVLMVGSELIKTEVYTERWRGVIEEVRQHYRGKLGYSANWDHYQTEKVGFWRWLDCVGMTSYYELAEGPAPAIAEIDASWARIKPEIVAFLKEVRMPLIFTEVGWCSQEGAAHEGWNYYANQKGTEGGLREQAALYESFLKAWSDEPGVGGIIWWEWDAMPGGKDDHGYTPRGKPAEALLRQWFASKPRRRDADTPRAASAEGD